MQQPRTDESSPRKERETGSRSSRRRGVLAAVGTIGVAGCAGLVRNSETETPDGTLPLQVTNQLTEQVMAEWGPYPEDGVSVGVEVAEIDSETLKETQLFKQELKVQQDENPRWKNVLSPNEDADEYVVKAWGLNEFHMDGKPLHETIKRFKPGEIGKEIGAEIDVWVGDASDMDGRAGIGFIIEPENRPLE